jgi:hypothetical protein
LKDVFVEHNLKEIREETEDDLESQLSVRDQQLKDQSLEEFTR